GRRWAMCAIAIGILLATAVVGFGNAQDEGAQSPSAGVERGSLIKFGEGVALGPNERTDNIVVFGGDVAVMGDVRQNVVVIGGDVRVSGRVGDAVVSVGQDVVLEASAVVNGDVVSVGGNVRRAANAVVNGDVTVVAWSGLGESWEEVVGFGVLAFLGLSLWGFVAWLIVMFVIGWLLLSLLPKPMERHMDAFRTSPMHTLGWGVLAFLLFVPLMVVLIFTVLGIALIPLLVLAYVYAGIVGVVVSALLLGHKLSDPLKREHISPVAALAIGLVILGLIRLIPVLGAIVTLVLWLFGFGIVLGTRFGTRSYGPQQRRPATATEAET
ncbi:MAG: hypothetical protein ABEK03_11195, partial [Candidatus Bipolaricaulia bacterium]